MKTDDIYSDRFVRLSHPTNLRWVKLFFTFKLTRLEQGLVAGNAGSSEALLLV